MTVDTDFSLIMSDGIASLAPYGTAEVTTVASLSSPWVDLGALTTDGFSESAAETRVAFKRWGDVAPYRTAVTDKTKTIDFSCLETKAAVLGLFYGGTDPVPSGTPTNEVQTVTITGSPTGGDFVLVFGDDATTDLAYNASAATVQTALLALASIGAGNATVSGSAGGPYTVTFVGALAATNVAQLTATGNFTGGTSPAVAVVTATEGSAGNLLVLEDDTTGDADPRAFVFDVFDGENLARFYVPNGEVTARKNPVYKTDTQTEYGMTVTAYKDPTLGYAIKRFYLLDALA